MRQGHINPDAPPMQEKKYVFHPTDQAAEGEKTVEAVVDEKTGHRASYVGENEEVDFEKAEDDIVTVDPFVPFDDLQDERHWIVTVRAMVSTLHTTASRRAMARMTAFVRHVLTRGCSWCRLLVLYAARWSILPISISVSRLGGPLALTSSVPFWVLVCSNRLQKHFQKDFQSWVAILALARTTLCKRQPPPPVVSRAFSSLEFPHCIGSDFSVLIRRRISADC